jgi:hypothetical protein
MQMSITEIQRKLAEINRKDEDCLNPCSKHTVIMENNRGGFEGIM